MNIRTRKLIGTILIVLFVGVYALLVMAFASSRLTELGWLASLLFYAGAGFLWVPGAALIIKWMEKPSRLGRAPGGVSEGAPGIQSQ
jgi:predicted tellurium resistance membrane protein TerC